MALAAAVAASGVGVAAVVVVTETVEATAWRRRWRRLKAEAIVVETIGTDVSAAAAWMPCLRLVRCWPVSVQREECLL
jgi:hypothetical protein